MNTSLILEELQRKQKGLAQGKLQNTIAKNNLKQEKHELNESLLELEASLSAQQALQEISQAIQQKAHDRIASVVSRCLSAVFDDPYEFNILFERKRGKTEARLVFVRDGREVDPISSSGGGVVDVASFALRVSSIMLSKPSLSKVVIMDEPFKFVSEVYRERVRDMLEMLSTELKIQFIFVTHMKELKTGTVIEL
jgi:DNA repair exonuclease SbcCD ATPase subunit